MNFSFSIRNSSLSVESVLLSSVFSETLFSDTNYNFVGVKMYWINIIMFELKFKLIEKTVHHM